MNTACATFSKKGNNLSKCTYSPDNPSENLASAQVFDDDGLWDSARDGRDGMEKAIQKALASGKSYPLEFGSLMLNSLRWERGLSTLLRFKPSAIKLSFENNTFPLLPELAPIRNETGETEWLDTVTPIYRTIDDIYPYVEHLKDKSISIIYQDGKLSSDIDVRFFDLAEKLQYNLANNDITVDIVNGYKLSRAQMQGNLLDLLRHIFLGHRAIIFLGHLDRSNMLIGNGWRLTDNEDLPEEIRRLPLKKIEDLLGKGSRADFNKREYYKIKGNPIPEVIFASCCSSAWRDPGSENSYPKIFLDAGVRYFIGTWTDIVLCRGRLEEEINILLKLISNFFINWANRPEQSIKHLYDAKKACGFHLMTSLFQLYTSSLLPNNYKPLGAIISGVKEGDTLGKYTLKKKMWSDPYAESFWATDTNDNNYIIQVLVDEWQESLGLEDGLNTAIEKLKKSGLNKEGHLIPDRFEHVSLIRNGQQESSLYIVIYERPKNEASEQWSVLSRNKFNPNDNNHFMNVLYFGMQTSSLLSQLHEKKIQHGNFSPESILFRKTDGVEHIFIKDTWIRHIKSGSLIRPKYIAPEEPAHEEGIDELKYDCWGLGVILFESLTGQEFDKSKYSDQGLRRSLKELMGSKVPDALDRVIRECLLPSVRVRPSAKSVATRLMFALYSGGSLISEFENELHIRIQAGYRLFAVIGDDKKLIESSLKSLALLFGYRLFTVAEGEGLLDTHTDKSIINWIDEDQLLAAFRAVARENNIPEPDNITNDEVVYFNVNSIFEYISDNLRVADNTSYNKNRPIILIHGNKWWESGEGVRRRFKNFQSNSNSSPVIVVTDSIIELEVELDRSFEKVLFPPPTPADIFENIIGFAASEKLNIPEVSSDTAIKLAGGFFPSTLNKIKQSLRSCALSYGIIDERALEYRERQIEELFLNLGAVDYTPFSKLPSPDFMGLPKEIEKKLKGWANHIIERDLHGHVIYLPQNILITGPDGCGKTSLARTIASIIKYPFLQINPTRCLMGRLGESEDSLHMALTSVSLLHKGLVLLHDIDDFLKPGSNENVVSPVTSTLERMSGIILNWIDLLKPGIILIMTSNQVESLPPQWRRRIELKFKLKEPVNDLDYRARVFTSVFKKSSLNVLSLEKNFMTRLADLTNPNNRQSPLLTPFSKKLFAEGSPLGTDTLSLETCADIEHWVQETILYNIDKPIEQKGFWTDMAS